ncbi:MAG: lamin tail domain-containing protein, partial [Planctomycetota bacterium]
KLQPGGNLLAIHGLNVSTTSSDLLFSVELIAGQGAVAGAGGISPNAIRYTGPTTLDHSTHVKARVLSGNTWSALNEAVYAVGPVAENLRITEIMYNPIDPNEEFIELMNIGAETINLNLVNFTNGIDFTFGGIELVAGEHVVVVRNNNVFNARYGTNVNILGEYSGKLNNAGERIEIQDAIGNTIQNFRYKDGWRSITDGEGFSLTIIDATNPDLSSWDEKDSWRPSAYVGGSPGQDDSSIVPEPGAIVINEVLAHSHAEASDWIELYNTTDTTIDIGGWFLSDSNDNLFKYKITNGTKIGPNGYLVLYEDLNFGNANDPGAYEPFALSENGERIYLSSAQNDILTGYRNVEDFGASETGVSFGRYYKPGTGNYNFVAMDENTPSAANSYPKVGPIVISEIMYNPNWPDGGTYTNDQYEYIELQNISTEPVTLYRHDKAEPWKFTDGIEFTFPADVPVTIPAGGYLWIVKKPAAFSWRYPAVPAGIILGPYDGNLSNAGESLELSMPGDFDKEGTLHYIRVDRVNYSDGSHPENCPSGVDLWPVEVDGEGMALTRKILTDYGNDPDNWIADFASPGE